MTPLDVAGWVLLALAILLLMPVGLLSTQVVAAALPARRRSDEARSTAAAPRVAVLVPAHDEAAGIGAVLRSLRAQLGASSRLLVVADNCTDDTAQVAASTGAEVIERCDPERRGKGYALDFGIRHLEQDPPHVVVMVDADCELDPGSLDRLVRRCAESSRPVQALYLMRPPAGAGLKTRIAAFAWVVKNQVRPTGCQRLGMPCQLMGTGMAFPWSSIRSAPLASAHLVEDLRLGLDLAAAGAAPLFCAEALVTSMFPLNAQGIAEQRRRWELGHLGVLAKEGPRALWRAVARRQFSLAAMLLDLCVPPLSLLLLLLLLQAAADATLFAFGGASVPLWLALFALGLLIGAIAVAWTNAGRAVVSLRELLGAPLYVLGKLPIYARLFRGGKREWVRTRRDRRHD